MAIISISNPSKDTLYLTTPSYYTSSDIGFYVGSNLNSSQYYRTFTEEEFESAFERSSFQNYKMDPGKEYLFKSDVIVERTYGYLKQITFSNLPSELYPPRIVRARSGDVDPRYADLADSGFELRTRNFNHLGDIPRFEKGSVNHGLQFRDGHEVTPFKIKITLEDGSMYEN